MASHVSTDDHLDDETAKPILVDGRQSGHEVAIRALQNCEGGVNVVILVRVAATISQGSLVLRLRQEIVGDPSVLVVVQGRRDQTCHPLQPPVRVGADGRTAAGRRDTAALQQRVHRVHDRSRVCAVVVRVRVVVAALDLYEPSDELLPLQAEMVHESEPVEEVEAQGRQRPVVRGLRESDRVEFPTLEGLGEHALHRHRSGAVLARAILEASLGWVALATNVIIGIARLGGGCQCRRPQLRLVDAAAGDGGGRLRSEHLQELQVASGETVAPRLLLLPGPPQGLALVGRVACTFLVDDLYDADDSALLNLQRHAHHAPRLEACL
mmetsp:Transcript_43247/g.119584  ORF Transcript_43247/g.119584 Transcript_43247/m.119584 type:complete len:325 (+) Transcript_43247:1247-2221(+)